jgi:formate hydrogenlyase subunit 3/multisubunit Na+/H+ antiporter MnhD subunit
MKLPNFRLYDVQATASMVIGILGLLCIVVLAWFVFHNFDMQEKVVHYNPDGGLGAYRRPLVMLFTAVALLVGATAGILGFNSLGQKRNNLQRRSWLGMTVGALVVAGAPILLYAWLRFSEALIRAHKG